MRVINGLAVSASIPSTVTRGFRRLTLLRDGKIHRCLARTLRLLGNGGTRKKAVETVPLFRRRDFRNATEDSPEDGGEKGETRN